MHWPEHTSAVQELIDPLFTEKKVRVSVLREDLVHPEISGNKWRKLKYNILLAKQKKLSILSFGGPFSNHLAALAAAGKAFGVHTIGLVRGEEADLNNPTLKKAHENGMQIVPISRNEYNNKTEQNYLDELKLCFTPFHLVPEGGSNFEGINGCTEILKNIQTDFDTVALACGTGSTLAGLVLSLKAHQKAIGFPAIKGGEYLKDEIQKHLSWYLMSSQTADEYQNDYSLQCNYHFGGFGKMNDDLHQFILQFQQKHAIALDGLYTGKMFFGLYDMIQNNAFSGGTRILAIHTGGLQGNAGLNARYGYQLPVG